MIKKCGDCENINSVNPLYLIFHSAIGYFKEKNGEEYLIIDSTTNMMKFFLESYQKSEQLMVEKNCFMKRIVIGLVLIQTIIYL